MIEGTGLRCLDLSRQYTAGAFAQEQRLYRSNVLSIQKQWAVRTTGVTVIVPILQEDVSNRNLRASADYAESHEKLWILISLIFHFGELGRFNMGTCT